MIYTTVECFEIQNTKNRKKGDATKQVKKEASKDGKDKDGKKEKKVETMMVDGKKYEKITVRGKVRDYGNYYVRNFKLADFLRRSVDHDSKKIEITNKYIKKNTKINLIAPLRKETKKFLVLKKMAFSKNEKDDEELAMHKYYFDSFSKIIEIIISNMPSYNKEYSTALGYLKNIKKKNENKIYKVILRVLHKMKYMWSIKNEEIDNDIKKIKEVQEKKRCEQKGAKNCPKKEDSKKATDSKKGAAKAVKKKSFLARKPAAKKTETKKTEPKNTENEKTTSTPPKTTSTKSSETGEVNVPSNSEEDIKVLNDCRISNSKSFVIANYIGRAVEKIIKISQQK